MQKILIELTRIYAIKKSVLAAGLGAIYQRMPSTSSASALIKTNTKDRQSQSCLTTHGSVKFLKSDRRMRSNSLIFKVISSNTKSAAISRKLSWVSYLDSVLLRKSLKLCKRNSSVSTKTKTEHYQSGNLSKWYTPRLSANTTSTGTRSSSNVTTMATVS